MEQFLPLNINFLTFSLRFLLRLKRLLLRKQTDLTEPNKHKGLGKIRQGLTAEFDLKRKVLSL